MLLSSARTEQLPLHLHTYTPYKVVGSLLIVRALCMEYTAYTHACRPESAD